MVYNIGLGRYDIILSRDGRHEDLCDIAAQEYTLVQTIVPGRSYTWMFVI